MSVRLEQETPQAKVVTPQRGVAPPWLPRVIVESALIVFSVLFALALDQWLQDRERTADAQTALASIRAELEANVLNVERARANHRAMQDSLTRYVTLNEPLPPSIYLGGIFNPAPTYAVAWESARVTGVMRDVPYELVLGLSRVYDEQYRYRELADALVQDIMMQIRREGADPVLGDGSTGFIAIQEDFSNREQHLLEAYRAILTTLDARQDGARR
jgi:hypothetical protein